MQKRSHHNWKHDVRVMPEISYSRRRICKFEFEIAVMNSPELIQ